MVKKTRDRKIIYFEDECTLLSFGQVCHLIAKQENPNNPKIIFWNIRLQNALRASQILLRWHDGFPIKGRYEDRMGYLTDKYICSRDIADWLRMNGFIVRFKNPESKEERGD